MLGLDAAGKTTILYKLHIGEVQSTVPTIGTPFFVRNYCVFVCLHLRVCKITASQVIKLIFVVLDCFGC